MYHEKQSVNPSAESALNVLAVVIHIIGVLMAVLYFLRQIAILETSAEFINYGEHVASVPFYMYILYFLAAVLVYFFCGLLPWAIIKVVINTSRSLMNISADVEEIKNSLSQRKE